MTSSLISHSQKDFIISSIQNDFRTDGRSNSQPQHYTLSINNLDHLLGSCLLSLDSSQSPIHIYTGIKIKVEKHNGKPTAQSQTNLKDIRSRIVLQLGCIKKLTEQQQQTRLYIQNYLNKFIVDDYLSEFKSLLSIPSSKRHHLSINIESYILSTPHISYLEHIHLCIKTAIQNIQMPEFIVSYNQVTDEQVIEVNLVEGQSQKTRQKTSGKSKPFYKGLKSIRLIGVYGDNYVKGMTVEQYESVDSCVLVALDEEERVRSFESLKGTLKVEQMHQIIKFAKS